MWARLSASSEYTEAREVKESGLFCVQALSPSGEWKDHLTWRTGAGNDLPGILTLESKYRRLGWGDSRLFAGHILQTGLNQWSLTSPQPCPLNLPALAVSKKICQELWKQTF